MSLWGRVVAASYDLVISASERAGLSALRAELLEGAEGRVLEIGGGTGANLGFYGGRVSELVVTEPEEAMARRLERAVRGSALSARVIRAPAERLPVESESFDCVVSTLVLCSVVDPARALGEVRRVLRRSGRLLFLEHVRSEDPRIARWQDRLRGPWSWVGCGCQCNRPTVELIRAAGLSVRELRRGEIPGAPAILRPLAIGAAARG